MESLNRQPLRVKGLARGNYRLRIDGEAAGSFSADQLASGINLAELSTPMARQAETGTGFVMPPSINGRPST